MKNPIDLNDLLSNAKTEEHIFFGKVLVIEYLVNPDFAVQGRCACVDPNEFDLEIGRKMCFQDAFNKLRNLEAYSWTKFLYQGRST